ncbi:protein kinase [Streptomyces sp. NPDC088732]|uniref:protein kinase domain-containing protein n=1 Tax=Streptomyces sp. NPDC088732 TaxID=3365879 RepID=UPI00382C08B8
MSGWSAPGYTESAELGSGGSGRVVLARHDATSTPVAIKYLSDELRTDAGFLREFRAEAQLLGGLDTPYVVSLYEYVEGPHGAAIVMELVDGIALRALLRQEGATGPEAALVVLKGSLLGLAAAHRTGVVHRDYKPENVLVAADGSSKLVDFGIAARSGETPDVAGTPAYMAPEQWTGLSASPATDVYAATATFYECLTGRKPFHGENFAELAVRHIEGPVPVDGTPEELHPLLRRGMAKEPADRPADAAAFVAELEGIAGAAYGPEWEERGQRRLAALAALLPLLFPSARAQGAQTALATTVIGQGGRRLGRQGLLAAVGGLALAGLLTFAAVASGEGPRQTTANWSGTTTTATPDDGSGAPGGTVAPPSGSPSSSPTASASPSAPSSVAPSASASATVGATASAGSAPPATSPTTSAPTGGTATTTSPPPTTGPPTTSASPTPPVTVESVSVTTLSQTGTFDVSASVRVTTSDARPVTLTVSWFQGTGKGEPGTPDGTSVFPLSGQAAYTITAPHSFPRTSGCWFGAVASTSPDAGNGQSTQQILSDSRQCVQIS